MPGSGRDRSSTSAADSAVVYGFGPDADFEGQLVGALERIESGGALRILDVLFVQSDTETGELDAVGLRGGRAGGIVAQLLGFRMDPAERRRATERVRSATRSASLMSSSVSWGRCWSPVPPWLRCSSSMRGPGH